MEMRAMAAQNDSLMAELRRQNRSTQDTIRRTSNQLFEIRGDVATRLAAIEDALDRLAELVGQNQRTMASVRDQLEAGGRRGSGGGGFDDPMSGGGSSDAVDLYNAAVRSYNQGQYTAARFGFENFIETFPGDPQVPDAWFYLAEALVQLLEPDAAIDAYRQVIQNYPASERVPGARVGLGLTYLEQGDTTEARIEFETVVNTWPDSAAATRAREALRGMGGGFRP